MLIKEFSSFRDNKTSVFHFKDKILRRVDIKENLDFKKFLESNFYRKNAGKIVKTKILNENEKKEYNIVGDNNFEWLEHEKIDKLIYPYELTFDQLKASAILFLDLYINAIKNSYDIIDASAFNIQFNNSEPIFIDLGSFIELKKESKINWYKQFCENYLAPLLIKSKVKINFNDIYKGDIEGINLKLASKILPLSSWFNFSILVNIHLQSYLNSRISSSTTKKIKSKKTLSSKQKILIASNLKKMILKLKSSKTSYWSNYSKINSYSDKTLNKKKELVSNFVKKEKIISLMDLGCNDGFFSDLCFNSGVNNITGVDYDLDSLNNAYLRFKDQKKNFFAIYQNFSNPSPGIGWNSKERKSFSERYEKKFDGIICLAFIHHICVGRNVPLELFFDYLCKFSDNILLEFVKKEDLMVKNLSENKKSVLKFYNLGNFKKIVSKRYKIISENEVSETRVVLHLKK
tara:strand:+ start:78 stop:1460 length:1383 start_codon:yes stop_codon:yes gene_type:complete